MLSCTITNRFCLSTLPLVLHVSHRKVCLKCKPDLQTDADSPASIADRIMASLDNLEGSMQRQLKQASCASAAGMTEPGVAAASVPDLGQSEAVVKANGLAAAASQSSAAWHSSLQSLLTLWQSTAVPHRSLQQARDCMTTAKQERCSLLRRDTAEVVAAVCNLRRSLQLRMQNESSTAALVHSACANAEQLETQHALHERIGGIVKEAYCHRPV